MQIEGVGFLGFRVLIGRHTRTHTHIHTHTHTHTHLNTHTHTHTQVMNEGWLDGSTSVVMAVTSRYIMVANAGCKVTKRISRPIITIMTIIIIKIKITITIIQK